MKKAAEKACRGRIRMIASMMSWLLVTMLIPVARSQTLSTPKALPGSAFQRSVQFTLIQYTSKRGTVYKLSYRLYCTSKFVRRTRPEIICMVLGVVLDETRSRASSLYQRSGRCIRLFIPFAILFSNLGKGSIPTECSVDLMLFFLWIVHVTL